MFCYRNNSRNQFSDPPKKPGNVSHEHISTKVMASGGMVVANCEEERRSWSRMVSMMEPVVCRKPRRWGILNPSIKSCALNQQVDIGDAKAGSELLDIILTKAEELHDERPDLGDDSDSDKDNQDEGNVEGDFSKLTGRQTKLFESRLKDGFFTLWREFSCCWASMLCLPPLVVSLGFVIRLFHAMTINNGAISAFSVH
ncbi:hypothetical protein HS088_TW23G00577 [Tripterygium wilfordii]|uniref:Uncharacterized protein n=1 Tax=Tripterygium wilfordii TaxID=458696 RepID=A0A7J7BW41_TRIWF|nr:hypothetical protein HS088_TW23G00577 [Tripterygium wilfordii]